MNLFKKVIIIFLIGTGSSSFAATYYVSPSGSNSNPGTNSKPWLTWTKGFSTAQAGDTVYFRGGVYPIPVTSGTGIVKDARYPGNGGGYSGTAANPVCFFNYPGETPILECSAAGGANNRGLHIIFTDYNIFKGLTVRNVRQRNGDLAATGILVEWCNNTTFENCTVHNIGGIGYGIADNYTIYLNNCDVYNNCDSLSGTPGGNGDGFQITNLNSKSQTAAVYLKGCRAFGVSDDGYGNYFEGYIEWNNCWAFNNGGILSGDGNSFKHSRATLTSIPLARKLVNCISANNHGVWGGFVDNSNGFQSLKTQVYNCVEYKSNYGFTLLGFGMGSWSGANVYKNNIAYANIKAPNYTNNGTYKWVEDHNSWDAPLGITITNDDFLSLDWTELQRPRKADGSLPDINFMKLAPGSDLIDAGTNVSIGYNGNAPDLGWFESSSGSSSPAVPVYVSSTIGNSTPSSLEITYNLALANILPSASSFKVMVNSVVRTVNSVSISGTIVSLTLSNPVVNGDIVTVAYTKPTTNPLQTAAGGQAITIAAQTVTNKVSTAVSPVYVSSSIENATPAVLDMVYNLSLAAVIPVASAFTVLVNSVARTVNSVAVSGTKVSLTLASPVVNGNIVTVAYIKPSTNPLQTAAGGQAVNLTAQSVTNKVSPVNPVYVSSAIENATPSILEMTYNTALAVVVPAASAFTVLVNSVARTVNVVTVSGTKVSLTLTSPVVNGNVVTVAYTKPTTNPLQTAAGGQAVTIAAKTVTNDVSPAPSPVYVSSSIENATPSVLAMVYNLSLSGVAPAASAFTVLVNSVARKVNSVAVSGTKVSLTLATPVVNGNVVTVAYTKPSTNPLQTAAGGQAVTIAAQTVTNNVSPAASPVYVSSSIENATPAVLEMVYNISLSGVAPAASAFTVLVNSAARTVTSVAVSGTKVSLTLATPVVNGNVVTVAYTKPSTNPLQTAAGGQAVTITAQTVTNEVSPAASPVYVSSSIENATPAVLEMVYNISLSGVAPAASAFTVLVNSAARTVTSVAVSGTKVSLTLATPVVNGNVVTVAYAKPSTNPLQTVAGGQAVTITAQTVTNEVSPAASPVYVSSSIDNATPSVLEMVYNLSLSGVAPAASAFTVLVNSAARTVTSVVVSGTKVSLTLATPVVNGNVVKVAYTKPSTNPLQTVAGGQAVTINAHTVTNKVRPAESPVYVSSSIENATPSVLEMVYNLSLSGVAPAASAFTVLVNSAARTVNSVAVSGTKVSLTLATPVVNGDVVTVAYTKPSTNPLQTADGGQAVTLTAQTVTNKVSPAESPVYVSSSIENAAPSVLEMVYNLSLAAVIPVASSFTVLVNSVERTVNSVVVSGTKVLLTLATPVDYEDIVTISYTKPAINPLQTVTGGKAASFSAQNVTNSIIHTNIPPTVRITAPENNDTFTAPAIITITANTSDIDGTIKLVEFYNGTTKLGSKSSPPFNFVWNNVTKGTYSITAVATDDSNAKSTSASILVSVSDELPPPEVNKPPKVTIASPHKGNQFENSADIEIEVIASDPDGDISKIELFNGSVKLAELNFAPYIFTWKGVSTGTYQIDAIATDNLNATTTSLPVEFIVVDKKKYDANSEIINIYPNPNHGHFTVKFLVPLINKKNEILISDLGGHQVYRETISNEETTKQFDLPYLRSGIYIMTVISSEIIVTKKIIIR